MDGRRDRSRRAGRLGGDASRRSAATSAACRARRRRVTTRATLAPRGTRRRRAQRDDESRRDEAGMLTGATMLRPLDARRRRRRSDFAALRAREFGRLDDGGHAYLDYTGSALYPDRLVAAHATMLRGSVFGNPHSESPTSLASTALVNEARARVLRFFDADPDEYVVCFTANTSAAIQLVASAYPLRARCAVHPLGGQPQLRERRARVRRARRRARALSPARRRAPAARRRVGRSTVLRGTHVGRGPRRVPRAVELLRRAASARARRQGARARLHRAARRGRVRADVAAEPARRCRPTSSPARSTRCSAIRPVSAR